MFLWEKTWLFGVFSDDKNYSIDVWMIKTNQMHVDVFFLQK